MMMPKENGNFTEAASQPSAVTWPVILWILFTLALNSIIQPAGRLCTSGITQRYRAYYCCSPIFCILDALSILVRVPWTFCEFDVPWNVAARLLLLARHTEVNVLWSTIKRVDYPKQRDRERRVFFVIGVIPATIKLYSCSGIPWTKVWGSMFLSSYIIFELLGFLSTSAIAHLPTSIPQEFKYDNAEWDSDENDVNRLILNLHYLNQGKFDAWLLFIARFSHVLLGFWVMASIWEHLLPFIMVEGIPTTAINILDWTTLIITTIGTVLLLLRILLHLLQLKFAGLKSLSSRCPTLWVFGVLSWTWTAISILLYHLSLGSRRVNGRPESGRGRAKSEYFFVGLTVAYLYVHVLQTIIAFIFKRYQWLGRAILLLPSRDETAETSSSSELAEVVVAVQGLLLLCFNLTVVIVWYAFCYNPVGSIATI